MADSEKRQLCPCCGAVIVQLAGRKQKRFCSDACRIKFYSEHPDSINKKAYYTFQCEYCGKEFNAYGNKTRKFCSTDCAAKKRFGTKEERTAARKAAVPAGAELPDMCRACPYYVQSQDAHKA